MANVLIVGGGKIGSALAKVIGSAVTALFVWDIDPKKTRGERDLSLIVANADVIFICVPSWSHASAIKEISPFLQKRTQVVSLAKGMVCVGNKWMLVSEFLKNNLPPNQNFSIMSGPMVAEDLTLGKPCVGVLVSKNQFGIAKLSPLFSKTNLRLEYSDDMKGVCLAGVLKNIYALAVGAVEGAGFAEDRVKVFRSMCLDEMLRAGVALGAKAETMKGTAGREDFLVTATSKFSHNRSAGMEIGRDGNTTIQSEGLVSLKPTLKILGSAEGLPIITALDDIVSKQTTAREAFKNILK